MRLDGVSYRYGRRGPWVLREVDVELPEGGTVVVLGRNGAGKSTLLQLAAGVLRPSGGVVRERPSPVGWVPERFPADQPFTVVGYLTAMARVHGTVERNAIEAWIDRLGLAPYRGTRLGELSKGTAQKVGLAQALIPGPGLLVLDEPWEGLDAAARELVPEIVAEVVAAGGSVLVSDHRGETGRLPGAVTWTVADGTVTVGEAGGAGETAIIEIAVPAGDAEATVAALRADGHDVVGVRTTAGVRA
ncbi:ABC transporter [Asanoa hainanensis]|uniref:ABC transporter n=1 Tax=Asanoa hainanensis TaxID=560556 RepID=A0A239HVH9_9ACTN|nr:ABC transporter ATP-binding protein [Asanoa hainanensis]SNS85319.1 ABC transporter [Asanoa hainanensis]